MIGVRRNPLSEFGAKGPLQLPEMRRERERLSAQLFWDLSF
jgi:hypothetical protein